jgi:hypothetical protein
MAERIVSPGVFTQERDLSFLPQGVAQIGAAFVGPTTTGPAFIPTSVQGIDGFVTTFGEPDGTSYTGYAVKNYLQAAGSATVVRVLGLAGYTSSVANLFATGSSGSRLFATIHAVSASVQITGVSASGTPANFNLFITGAQGSPVTASGLSTNEVSASFISNYFGTNPQVASKNVGYVYAVFPDAIAQAGANVTLNAVTASLQLNTINMPASGAYSNASTPWIRSQDIGSVKHDLFKVHTLSDGSNTNKLVKISITGISPSTDPDSEYGTFTLLVRDFGDTDTATNVLESFDNLTLNPDSPNYIARRIGDSAPTYTADTGETLYEGDYPNLSKYIRIQMVTDSVIPENAVPYGFAPLSTTVPATAGQLATGSYVTSRWLSGSTPGYTTASVDKRYYYGYDFSNTTSLSYLGPVEDADVSVGTEFNIGTLAEVPVAIAPFSRSIALTGSNSRTDVGYRRFTVPMQGGFDGLNPAREIQIGNAITTKTLGFDLATSTSDGSLSYKRALDTLSNADNVDLNLLVIPGVLYSQHSYIAQTAIDLCEQRGDCFYIMDADRLTATISDVINVASRLDTSYAATYYPWVRVLDTLTNKQMWAPPSVVLPEVYAYNDSVGAEWFAPAGLNRGGIPGAIGVKVRLGQGLRDELYENKVNPIAQFPGQGITIWGQKTLQRKESALDRVNVRRLLITVKKFIASSARYLVFEQNTDATRNRFLNIVNPYLAGIQQRSGLTAFRVVMDETNNTPDVIDRNILQGAIYLQPTRAVEFIKLDFNILPTGATFDTI